MFVFIHIPLGTVYGDPHITTFDGKSYYFGGSGDFWILKSDVLNIQGRFEERENQCTSTWILSCKLSFSRLIELLGVPALLSTPLQLELY